MNNPTRPQPADELSTTLKDLRRQAGLSGMQAAERTGFSQPKISRMETGRQVPTTEQIRNLCRIYHAPAASRRRLLELVDALRAGYTKARVVLSHGAHRQQQRIGHLEQASALIRGVQPALVFGLLQTPDYTRATGSRDMTGQALEEFVAARAARQAVLDSDRQFQLVLTEGALRWHVGSPQVMAAQLTALVQATHRPNLDLGVIPWTRPVNTPVLHGFTLFDSRAAIVGTETGTAVITDPVDVADYENRYTGFAQLADFGPAAAAVFDRLAGEYRALD